MKILVINMLYYPYIGGGAEITIRNLYEGLRKRGHEISVLSLLEKNRRETKEEIQGITVYRKKIKNIYLPYGDKIRPVFLKVIWHIIDIYNPLIKNDIMKVINDVKPDIVMLHNTSGYSIYLYDILYKLKLLFIQVLHDQYLLCPTSMFKNNKICSNRCWQCRMLRLPYKVRSSKAAAVVGVSRFVLHKFLLYGYFKKTPIKRYIYNSRDFSFKIKTRLRQYDGEIVFGFIGTLAPNKGIEFLLKAFRKVGKKNWHLLVAGKYKGDYGLYLRNTYKDKNINFLGSVSPQNFFPNIDASIVPSIWEEPLGMVVVESFYFGVPVIGSNLGGIPEMIQDGRNGVLFNPYKDGELENKMVEFEINLQFWKDKRRYIQKTAEKFLNYSRWIDEWEELIQKVLGKKE